MNKVLLIGNLTKDVELNNTTNGVALAKFTLAVARRYEGPDGTKETDFFNIVAWRGLAETCKKYLKKGSKAAIFGSIHNRTYDAADGTKRYVTDIQAEDVLFLSAKQSDSENKEVGEQVQTDVQTGSKGVELTPIDDDSLPF